MQRSQAASFGTTSSSGADTQLDVGAVGQEPGRAEERLGIAEKEEHRHLWPFRERAGKGAKLLGRPAALRVSCTRLYRDEQRIVRKAGAERTASGLLCGR